MEDVSVIVEQFGGTTALARLCEVEPSAVSQWKAKKRIPKSHIKFLRMKRPDLFGLPLPQLLDLDEMLGELGAVLRDDERTALKLAFERGPQYAIPAIEALDLEVSIRAQLLAAAQAHQEAA